MEIIEKVFNATMEALYSVVGSTNMSDEDAIIGFSSMAIIGAILAGSFWLLRCKIKLNYGSSVLGSIGITIGAILLFCLVCIIIQH